MFCHMKKDVPQDWVRELTYHGIPFHVSVNEKQTVQKLSAEADGRMPFPYCCEALFFLGPA